MTNPEDWAVDLRRLERFDAAGEISPTAERPRTTWDLVEFARSKVIVGQFVRDSARFRDNPHLGPFALADRDLVRTLTVTVLSDRLPPERATEVQRVVFKEPATPWDMFKDAYQRRWWLAWLVRRRPARFVDHVRVVTLTVDMQRWRTFPEADVPYPTEFGPARYHAVWSQHTVITDPPGNVRKTPTN